VIICDTKVTRQNGEYSQDGKFTGFCNKKGSPHQDEAYGEHDSGCYVEAAKNEKTIPTTDYDTALVSVLTEI